MSKTLRGGRLSSKRNDVAEFTSSIKDDARLADAVIDINKASPEEFAKLPGIGPKRARQIVAFREKHGPFRRVEDLLAIRGIGHKKWKAIRPFLRVGQDAKKN